MNNCSVSLSFHSRFLPQKTPQDLNGEEELENWKGRSSELCKKYAISQEVKDLMERCEAKARSVKVNYQPYMDTLDELFDFHEKRAPKFTTKVEQLAEGTGGKPLIPGLKGKERCLAKAAYKYGDAGGVAWYRLTDIVRPTILYPSISAMYNGLEAIEKDESIEIIELNDRYQKLDHEVYRRHVRLRDDGGEDDGGELRSQKKSTNKFDKSAQC